MHYVENTDKVAVRLKPIGRTPILSSQIIHLDPHLTFAGLIVFLKRKFGLTSNNDQLVSDFLT